MNFDDIRQTWQSSHNRPSGAELEKLKMNLITELRRQRRANTGLLVLTLCPLVFFTAKVILHLLSPAAGTTPVDLSREWAVLPFFALPWIGWFVLLGLQRRHAARHRSYEGSIVSSVAALLDETRTQRVRHNVVCILLGLSVPAVGLVVYQLRNVGKAGNEILLPTLVLYPAYVLAMVLWLYWHNVRKTQPREQELESLLREYRQQADAT